MKRLRTLCLMSFLAMTLAIQAYNVGDVFTTDNIKYKIRVISTTASGGAVVPGEVGVAGTTKTGTLTVPATVTDDYGTPYKVVAVMQNGFNGVQNVTSIVLPEGITIIDKEAFAGCRDLVSVTIPSTVTSIGTELFTNSNKVQTVTVAAGNATYSDIDGVLCDAAKQKLIVYPQGRAATSYTVPASIKTVGEYAFSNCSNLQSVDLGSATALDKMVFFKCQALKSVHFSQEMASIDVEGFYDECRNLEQFTMASGNTHYAVEDGMLFTKDKTILMACPPKMTMTTAYQIPNTVKEIAGHAFYFSKLTGITIPGSVQKVHMMAFEGSDLETVTIEEGANNFGDRAFMSCVSLTQVNVPASLVDAGENIFLGCDHLEKIDVAAANPKFQAVDGVMFADGVTKLYCYPAGKTIPTTYTIPSTVTSLMSFSMFKALNTGELHIPASVKELETGALERSQFSKIIFDPTATVEKLGASAFNSMPNLTELTIPASVKSIGKSLCLKSPKLATVNFEDNAQLTSMDGYNGAGAFEGCQALTTVNIGNNSPITIGPSAFKDCKALTTVNAGTGSLKTVDTNAFLNCTALTNLNVSNSGLTEIKTRAFQNCTALATVAMPSSLEKIGESSFTECSGLSTVTFPSDAHLNSIERNAFQNSGITNITLPHSLKQLGKEAFNRCKQLQTINIPKETTRVDAQAFISCSKLTAINVDPANPLYSSLDGMLVSKDKKRLKAFPPGKANTRYTRLPAFIEAIDSAFYSCEELTNVTIPQTVTSLGNFAFSNTKNLKSISFLGDIPTLQPQTFLNTDTKPITLFVRKEWYENPANAAKIATMKGQFKDVHPSFIIGGKALDRGVEYFPLSINTVGVIAFKPERTSVIIPLTAEEKDYPFGGTTITTNYGVATVLDHAFENNTTTESVVFMGPLEEIGLNAFSGTSNHIRDIYFVDDTAPKLASVNFETPTYYPFTADQNVYVKESKVADYQAAFTDPAYTGTGIAGRVTHKIPQTTGHNGGSICYPFDVRFPNRDGLADDIKPYVPLVYKETPKLVLVKARSVDDYYVPANMGVLIRSKQQVSVTAYCQMDEAQPHTPINVSGYVNNMKGTLEDLAFTDNSKTYFAFNKKSGKFQKVNGKSLPYFKSYLELGTTAGAKQIQFVFDDEESATTGIADPRTEAENASASPYYDLNGIPVEKPGKGIYIHNGKKVVIK